MKKTNDKITPPESTDRNLIICVPRNILVRTDSLLSLLVWRHRRYMEKIGEWKEAKELYELCREFSKGERE